MAGRKFSFSFVIPPLPKDVYQALKARRAQTGQSDWEVVVESLKNNLKVLPVQTVTTPPPTRPSGPPPTWNPTSRTGLTEAERLWFWERSKLPYKVINGGVVCQGEEGYADSQEPAQFGPNYEGPHPAS